MARRRSDRDKARGARAADSQPARRRWRVIVWAALALGAALGLFFLWPGRSQADLRRIEGQNVLLVTIDTLRADALGCYGGPAATPALDRLAAEGVRFDFAHAHAVMTLPSHASILTGRYPFEHGLRDNSGFRFPRDGRTAATMLQKAGYATAAFLASFPLHSRFGLNVGFDVYDDRFTERPGPDAFTMPERPASAVVALAREWLADRSKPWFLWVHVFEPHAPYRPPPPFDAQYASNPYYGEVAATDAALAPLLDDVRKSARPTLVIVTSDHGEGLGDHGEEAHGIFAYESTLRVPLIVAQLGGAARVEVPTRPDGRPASGEVSPAAARHVDILPTILDAVGQPTPPGIPGRTLLPRKERVAGSPARVAYFEAMSGMLNHGWAPLSGVLSGRDKFIDLPIAERYDLSADPAERSNLAGRVPDRDRVLEAALAALGPLLPGQRVAEDPDTSARLRALGYVSGDAPRKARYTEDDDPKRLVDLDSAVHRALDARSEGRNEEAATIYRQMIERRPGMAIAYRHLAFVEWQRGNATGAIGVLRQAVARGVTDARLLAQLGEYLTETGRLAEGISVLEQAAGDLYSEVDALSALGIAYARAGRPADARRAFERLLEALPGSSAPLEGLGMLALDQGDVSAAKDYFARAVAAAPSSSRAHAGAGMAAFAAGDRATAYAAWSRAVELDPANFEALLALGLNLARDGRTAEARPHLERFQREAPSAVYPEALKEVSRLLKSGR